MTKKIIYATLVTTALAAGCNGSDSNGDLPELNADNTTIPSSVEPCDPILVQMNVPAYDGNLTAGATLDGNAMCEEQTYTPQDTSRTFSCSYDTCNEDGEQTVIDGIVPLCLYIQEGSALEDYCEPIDINGGDADTDSDTDSDTDTDTDTDVEDIDVLVNCAQDTVYLNHVICNGTVSDSDASCQWSRNSVDIEGATDCAAFMDEDAPTGDVTYQLDAVNGNHFGEGSETLGVDYETPVLDHCHVNSTDIGAYFGGQCNKGEETSNGNETLFQIGDHNLETAEGESFTFFMSQLTGSYVSDQLIDQPQAYTIEFKLCEDADGDGEITEAETLCDSKTYTGDIVE